MAVRRLSWLVGPLAFSACAGWVGYDDLTVRPVDGGGASDAAEVALDGGDETADGADAGPRPVLPPARPTGRVEPSGTGKTVWFAVRRFWMGSLSASDVPSDTAWRALGFDVDRHCTSAEDSTLNIRSCLRPAGAKPTSLTDGDGCRDNNFGQHVVSMVKVASPDFETKLAKNVLSGQATLLLALDDLDDGPDDAFVPARLYTSTGAKTAPRWDGTDERVVASDTVTGGSLATPITTFPRGYLVGDVWVSGDPTTFFTMIPVAETPAPMRLEGGVITMVVGADRRGGAGGVLAGGVRLTELEPLLRPIAASAGLCPGTPFYTSAVTSVKTFADLVSGAPSLQDESVACDMLSVGVGLDVVRVVPVTKVEPPTPPTVDKCADAG